MSEAIKVPLGLEGFEVTDSEVVEGTLEVRVRSTRRPACHHCGSLDVIGHGTNVRTIRDRSCRFPTVLRWAQRRFRCRDCDQTCREQHPEIAGRKAVTKRYRRHLFERAGNEPFTDVARSESVSAYRVLEAFEHHAAESILGGPKHPPRVLAIDESAFRKRFRFHTVFSDPERRVVFDLVEGRHAGAVITGLLRLDDQVRAGIETVVMDMHWAYRQAIEMTLPNARIVADRFHVVRVVDRAAHRVKVRCSRRSRAERTGRDGGKARQHNPTFDPAMFGARWVFMKRHHKLTPDEERWLGDVLARSHPDITVAWWLKEQFAEIYRQPDRASAERVLQAWIDDVIDADIPEFTNVWRTMQWWVEPILAYFDDRVTNAFAEGITNKIKVMKRRSYGFRDPERYRQKVLLACGHRAVGAG